MVKLASNSKKKVEKASMQPILKDPKMIVSKFVDMTTLDGLNVRSEDYFKVIEKEYFKEMFLRCGKALTFEPIEISFIHSVL